jgi:hypothetical protein
MGISYKFPYKESLYSDIFTMYCTDSIMIAVTIPSEFWVDLGHTAMAQLMPYFTVFYWYTAVNKVTIIFQFYTIIIY